LAGRIAGEYATLERIYFFSALPNHMPRTTQQRHRLYMRCLRATGVNVELGRFFKNKSFRCPRCRGYVSVPVEKETDVAVAARLFELCQSDAAETIVLVTGDTDLAPAVRTCKRLFPDRLILFAFPYMRVNAELQALAPESFSIKATSYLRYQLPDPLVLKDGTELHKPSGW